MKLVKAILSIGLLIASVASSANAAGEKVDLQNALGLNCRPGEGNYWESNKGFRVDFRGKTLTFYKDNGRTDGKEVSMECNKNGDAVQCAGDDVALALPNVQNQSVHSSSDVSDALGGFLGGGPKRATVTPGVLVQRGWLGSSQEPVLCIVR